MDVVAGAIDVRRHFRVPAVSLVAEVNTSFQELAHAEVWQSHSLLSFPVGLHGHRRMGEFPYRHRRSPPDFSRSETKSVCGMSGHIDAAAQKRKRGAFRAVWDVLARNP